MNQSKIAFMLLACLFIVSTGCNPNPSTTGKATDSGQGDFSEFTDALFIPDIGLPETPQSYQEEGGSLAFQYPSDWKITETEPGGLVTLQGPTENVAMTVSKGKYVKKMEKISKYEFGNANNKKLGGSAIYHSYDRGKLNDQYCISTGFTAILDHPSGQGVIDVEHRMFIIFYKDQVYTMVFDGLVMVNGQKIDDFSQALGGMNAIINSIRFSEETSE